MTAYRTILVDTDGSDYSYRVVDHAAELAHVTHARLLIICARHDIDERALGTDVDRLRGTTPTDAILRTAHQHAIAHGAVDIETRILPEPTVRALFHLAGPTADDLIVTANPHRSPLARLLLPRRPSLPTKPTATSSLLMVRTPTEGVHDRAHTQHQHTRDRRPRTFRGRGLDPYLRCGAA